MIILMNIIISLIGLGGIILARYFACKGTGIKSHLIILALKLIVCFIILWLFLIYSEQHIWLSLILSGMINIIMFHFIEAFITQRKLLHQGEVNV